MKYEYFTDEETRGMDANFMGKLVRARKRTIELDPARKGVPFRGTSWKRTLAANKSVIGAVPDSAHLFGLAVDLRVYNTTEAGIVVAALIQSDVLRIGVYRDLNDNIIHIHADDDRHKVYPCLWGKKEQN